MSTLVEHPAPLPADPICVAAVDTAWESVLAEVGPSAVGAHLAAVAESELVVMHTFDCTLAGYRGWQWHVTLTRAPDTVLVTTSEVDLLPTQDSLIAPSWVPWNERIKPGDLSVGNVVPTNPQDPRLAPGWSDADELGGELDAGPLHPINWEPGLGRPRVPSKTGREEAAKRWYRGENGPSDPVARAAPGQCSSCGWMLTIGGPLGQDFGICSNVLSPSDGRVVSYDHGCGGHSEEVSETTSDSGAIVIDDHALDDLDMGHS